MSRLGIVAIVALLAGCVTGARAQESDPSSKPAGIETLIEQLDSDDFATREAASSAIALLGDGARAALVAGREKGSLERRMRIDQILGGLATRAASRPDRRVATLVTLELAEKPLSEACAALSRASGYAVRIPPGLDPTVTISAREVPFFQALDMLSAQASRRTDWDPKTRSIQLSPTPDKPAPTVYPSAMRVTLVSLNVTRQVRFGGSPYSAASLQIRVDAEEKMRAIGVLSPLKATELIDDRKRDLRTDQKVQSQTYLQRMDQRMQTQVFLQLNAPDNEAKSIARIELMLPMVVAETFEATIVNPEEGLETAQGQFRAKIEQWKAGPGQLEVWISINRPAIPALGSLNSPVQDDVVTFLGPDGQAIQPLSTSSSGSPGIMVVATLPPGSKIASVAISSLRRVDVVEVPVVFENVPLP